MQSGKTLIYIIIIISCFLGAVALTGILNFFWAGFNARLALVFVAFGIIVFVLKILNYDLKKTRAEAHKELQDKVQNQHGRRNIHKTRHIDFMTNRATAPACEKPLPSTPDTVSDIAEETVNGVVWRWRPGRRGPEILGAFCSICAQELVAGKTSVSWEADLRCGGCGKTFISMAHTGPNAKPRSFGQTKKLVAQIINDRLSLKR